MKQDESSHIIDLARSLAEDAMELHVLSFRMGAGASKDEDYRACQRIIAEADALMRTIDARSCASDLLVKP